MSELFAFVVVGVVTGAIYAIAASGLVVTYTTSGIFNFAHGAVGMVMAFAYWELRVNRGWPAPLALIAIVFVAAPLLGAAIERLLMRGLQGATVAVSLVVTVGLLVFLLGAGQAIWDPGTTRNLPAFFGDDGNRLGDVFVTRHQQVTVAAALVIAGLLYVILFRTRVGVGMRAVVDDRNLVALNGGRPSRISMTSWALGSSLAAVAGILIAPILLLNHLPLTLLVVNAYAAAMVGRLRSLPLTFLGGLILGLIEALAVGYYGDIKRWLHLPGWMDSPQQWLPTVFLFLLLLLLPQARLRVGRLVGSATPRVPDFRESALGAAVLAVGVFVITGFLDSSNIARVGQGLALGIVMLSLVVLVGYGAQVSLCQLTFAGLGAYAMAKLGEGGNPTGLVAAVVLAGVVGAVVALPALRLQGLYLALSTMAFAVLMDKLFFANQHIFGLGGSLKVPRLELPGLSFAGERAFVVLLAVAFGLMAMQVLAIRRGNFGRLLSAMRDSPAACATLGLSLTLTKLRVFALAAAMAGLGGALYGGLRTTAGADDFRMFQSLPLLLLAVVGGITSPSGALVGGMAFALMPVLQEQVESFSGLVFLLTGAAAVSLGRNPNGLAYLVSQRIGPLLRRGAAPPAGGGRVTTEEVLPVGALGG